MKSEMGMLRFNVLIWVIGAVVLSPSQADCQEVEIGSRLGKFKELTWEDDVASRLVEGVDRFLLGEIESADRSRVQKWTNEFRDAKDSESFFAQRRDELKRILGIRDSRIEFDSPELITTVSSSSLLAQGSGLEIHAIRFPVFESVTLEGLWLRPADKKPIGSMVVIPDADQTPEDLAGLSDKLLPREQIALQLARQGHQVVVPTLISRKMEKRNGRANLTHREFLYRSAFELGRHIIGYEIQKVLAVIDWYKKTQPDLSIGVWGTGEGGMLAMYAAAVDSRIQKVAVDDFIGGRNLNWKYPISRNVFGLLNRFGDAEVLAMISPRPVLHIHHPSGIKVNLPSEGGAPAELSPATADEVDAVYRDLQRLTKSMSLKGSVLRIDNRDRQLVSVVQLFGAKHLSKGGPEEWASLLVFDEKDHPQPTQLKIQHQVSAEKRQRRQINEIDRFNQLLLDRSEKVRQQFMGQLKTDSLENYQDSVEDYRQKFAEDIVGRFDLSLKSFNPRVRLFCKREKYDGYEVVLDVFDDVIAYGILLLPNDLKDGEKRPVVVCQHGLEGRPQDIVQGDHPAYHDFAAKLAEEGFITFSPQNLYIFRDRFRTLQRKANLIGKTLFSVIVPQHQQIVNWLKSLPNVDPNRIAFYGLSYGGKSAMRIPPLVNDYCLSICSADFNEWVWKNASTSSRYSYVWTGEYEIFEFDLGSTFNYSEMAALIAPRPFMVERGHFDGVSSDEKVAYEFAKVRHLYQARLKIGDRCEIEFFDGPHTIHGKGTFRFLRKHLQWPRRP